jgi:hypothetical protein
VRGFGYKDADRSGLYWLSHVEVQIGQQFSMEEYDCRQEGMLGLSVITFKVVVLTIGGRSAREGVGS